MPKIRIVIQSRLSSARLPAKALLPVAGLPAVVLCALRAANTGIETLVATSTDISDDLICQALNRSGIKFWRGPLDDVLERYELATRDLEPGSIVVRMTADNLLPDGGFVREMIDALIDQGLVYLGPNDHRLPYGLAAEVFTVDVLREASQKAGNPYEREHVTPWIGGKYNRGTFKSNRLERNFSRLRCTIDTLEDYLRVAKVFNDIVEPINVSWVDLCEKLAVLENGPDFKLAKRKKNGFEYSELTLGTAQLGMNYGIANRNGKPATETAIKIIHKAIGYGLNSIDTARGYGEAELRIGESLKGNYAGLARVVTKLDPLIWLEQDQSQPVITAAVDASVFRSCRELQMNQLPAVSLHRWKHRHACQGAIWQRLAQLKEEKVIGALGASVQTPEEALEAAQETGISLIQLPFNMLDWRWREAGVDQSLLKRKDLVVQARSVFLQGLLAAEVKDWPQIKGVNAGQLLAVVDELVKTLDRASWADLCIAYVRAHSWIDSLVIGMETIQQLEENIKLFQNDPLTIEEVSLVKERLGKAPVELLNPALWNLK